MNCTSLSTTGRSGPLGCGRLGAAAWACSTTIAVKQRDRSSGSTSASTTIGLHECPTISKGVGALPVLDSDSESAPSRACKYQMLSRKAGLIVPTMEPPRLCVGCLVILTPYSSLPYTSAPLKVTKST